MAESVIGHSLNHGILFNTFYCWVEWFNLPQYGDSYTFITPNCYTSHLMVTKKGRMNNQGQRQTNWMG